MDNSPRSDDGSESRVPELARSRSIYKEDFVLEESRPKDPLIMSGSDTVSSSSSSHQSSPRDYPLYMHGNTKTTTNRMRNNTQSVNVGSGVANRSTKSSQKYEVVGSRTAQGGIKADLHKQSSTIKTDKSVPKNKGNTGSVTNSNTSNGSTSNSSKSLTLNSSAASITQKTNIQAVPDQVNAAKSGGSIVVHKDINTAVDKLVANGKSKTSDPIVTTVTNKDTSKKTDDKKNDNISAGKGSNKIISPGGNAAAKKKNEKSVQSVLHVVPTKLTENIVRTAPKNMKDENSEIKTVRNKVPDKPVSESKQNMNNLNMQLSASAQVVNRVSNNMNNDKSKESSPKPVPQKNSTVNEKDENVSAKENMSNVSNSVKASTKTVAQGDTQASSQPVSAKQAQSRNVNFNISKSATIGGQRSMGNVRKTSTFTPRFQSNGNSKQTTTLPNKEIKDVSSGKADKINANSKNVSKAAEKKSDVTNQKSEIKALKPNSPTELVGPSVSKSASISKSYNMTSTKPVNNATPSDNPSLSKSVSVSERREIMKHAELSKSVSDSLEKAGKVSNASIVSKSICQMPSVGTVSAEKSTPTKGLPRSLSMSTIEEKKEKQLMSSSDTKIRSQTDSQKQRPASDGPSGISGSDNNINKKANKPLVEILPEGAPRISQKSYVDIKNPFTTPPVIVNPFEELEQARALTATDFGFVIDKPTIERSKTQGSMKGKKLVKKSGTGKPMSAQSRGSSAKKKRSQNKDGNKSDTENSRPKSGKSSKRVKSGKRKRKVPVSLTKENEKPDVALIGGIGWQIATSCIDKTDADAVKVSQIDSSESESECVELVNKNKPLYLDIPADINLHIPNAIETPSSAHSPRFREVLPAMDASSKERLPHMENDGYRPMNLDLTQNSFGSQNRSGVLIGQDMPGDIGDFLSQLREDEAEDEMYYNDNDFDYEDENGNIDNGVNRGGVFYHLTPIPESPSLSNTLTSTHRITSTHRTPVTQAVEAALQRFEQNVKEEDLNKLLGATPRDNSGTSARTGSNMARRGSGSMQTGTSKPGSAQSNSQVSRGSSGTVGTNSQPVSAHSRALMSRNNSATPPQPTSATRKGQQSKNIHPVAKGTNLSAGTKDRINNSFSKSLPSSKYTTGEDKERRTVLKSVDSIRKSASMERLDKSKDSDNQNELIDEAKFNSFKGKNNSQTKTRIDTKITDLKKMLADKLSTTQKLLEESNIGKKKNQSGQEPEGQAVNELKLNMKELTEANLKALDSNRTEDDAKSTRSSRRERRYSETKKETKEDDINEAIDEILSNTFPSMRSTLKSNASYRSATNTLTERDQNMLKHMIQENHDSPFHAQGAVKISSSFDDSVTLNRDNPDLMKRFQGEDYHMGQKVKAMQESGAESSKIKAMVKADSEAKQIAKIMHSFKQMELYAGSHNKSSRKETPRRDGEHVVTSMSRFDHGHGSHSGLPPRPGSAGAGRHRPGKFTEIKGKSATEKRSRAQSPVHVNVPKVSVLFGLLFHVSLC